MKYEYRETSGIAPAISAGLGYYFNRFCGIELKYAFSALSSPFPDEVGKHWTQFTLNFRFPVPGQAKGGWHYGKFPLD
jgi:hypothetical protein